MKGSDFVTKIDFMTFCKVYPSCISGDLILNLGQRASYCNKKEPGELYLQSQILLYLFLAISSIFELLEKLKLSKLCFLCGWFDTQTLYFIPPYKLFFSFLIYFLRSLRICFLKCLLNLMKPFKYFSFLLKWDLSVIF